MTGTFYVRPLALALLVAAVIVLAGTPAARSAEGGETTPPAATEPNTWSLVLKEQARAEKRCDVREILNFREFDLGTEKAVEGRLSCVDGREYDFSRPRPHQKFKFEICEPAVC